MTYDSEVRYDNDSVRKSHLVSLQLYCAVFLHLWHHQSCSHSNFPSTPAQFPQDFMGTHLQSPFVARSRLISLFFNLLEYLCTSDQVLEQSYPCQANNGTINPNFLVKKVMTCSLYTRKFPWYWIKLFKTEMSGSLVSTRQLHHGAAVCSQRGDISAYCQIVNHL